MFCIICILVLVSIFKISQFNMYGLITYFAVWRKGIKEAFSLTALEEAKKLLKISIPNTNRQ